MSAHPHDDAQRLLLTIARSYRWEGLRFASRITLSNIRALGDMHPEVEAAVLVMESDGHPFGDTEGAALNERWYRQCRERGIEPPIGPDGPPADSLDAAA